MMKAEDILITINNLITQNFEDIEIQSTDISEGFKRPSFFIEIEKNKTSTMMTSYKEKNIAIRIYYFPSSRHKNKIELLEVQEKLEEIFFQNLKVNDTYIGIDETEAEVTDGVLQFSFDLYTMQEIEDLNEYEMIDTLDINIRKD